MAVLEVRDLHARYSARGPEILKGISFDVEGDDFFAIIGPSSRAGARPCCFSRSTSSGCSAPVTAYAAIHAWDVRMMQLAALCRGRYVATNAVTQPVLFV